MDEDLLCAATEASGKCGVKMAEDSMYFGSDLPCILTGTEAHMLLFTLDWCCSTNRYGKVTAEFKDFDIDDWQKLRDKLFIYHEHEEE